MLSLCKQIIYEWEVSQGRSGDLKSAVLEQTVPKVLVAALKHCSIEPTDENLKLLTTCIYLLHCKTEYEEDNAT